VYYQLSGTASNGVDVTALPGSIVFAAGAASTSLVVSAISDMIAEGDKTLTVSLQPGPNYTVGAFNNAVIQVLDTPFDAWRFAHFNQSELAQISISGPDADPDHDGVSNWQEFLGGTNPRDATSVLRVAIDALTNTAVIKFFAGSNHAFTLQYRDNLSSGPWLDFTNIAPAISNRTIACSDPLPSGVTNRFYRVSAP
jgi:hypothetical protein